MANSRSYRSWPDPLGLVEVLPFLVIFGKILGIKVKSSFVPNNLLKGNFSKFLNLTKVGSGPQFFRLLHARVVYQSIFQLLRTKFSFFSPKKAIWLNVAQIIIHQKSNDYKFHPKF